MPSSPTGLFHPPNTPHRQRMREIEAEMTELYGHINAATYRFLQLLAEFDREEGWAQHGVMSCAHWLNWQCGIAHGAAREKVRVARALESLPLISDAFGRGVLSYSKVRAITRIANADNEAELLMIAEHGTAAHVEKLIRKYRLVERLEEAYQANDLHRRRELSYHYDQDGSIIIRAKLPPEVGALVRRAIEAAMQQVQAAVQEQDEDEAVLAARRDAPAGANEAAHERWGSLADRYSARRADALRLLAEAFLERQAAPAGSVADRHQVVVHIDQRLLAGTDTRSRGNAEVPLRCELEDERELAVETARRLACDCSVVGIVEDAEGEPLSVGRKTRKIPPTLQRALKARDGGCRYPGCGRTMFTEGHHVRHWALGGETKLSNLITLCRFHHRLIHEGGFGLRATDDGVFVFTRPDGTRVDEAGGTTPRFRGNADSRSLATLNVARGLDIDADTSRCKWRGERMDYGWAVARFMQLRDQHDRRVQRNLHCVTAAPD